MARSTYVFDTSEETEQRRLDAQSALWDPFTFRRLGELGVGDGWRCLEIGGGAGSVAVWLLARVGRRGHVVATDLETSGLERLHAPHLEVRRHDVVADPLEASHYDLIHARLVLSHLPQRDTIVAKLASALRPGGWLVVDDYDLQTVTISHPADALWARVGAAVTRVLEHAGADSSYGRKLGAVLRDAGLDDVDAEGQVLLQRPPDVADVLGPIIERLRAPMVRSGAVSATDLDRVLDLFGDGQSELSVYSPIMVSTRGRQPEHEAHT